MINKKIIGLIAIAIVLILFTPKTYAYYKESEPNQIVDNILLIGKDKTKDSNISRSDTMIILTIDNLNKSLKLTSLTRDTLVDIPNKGAEKLNHAFAYGGPKLLIETIKNNLGIDIKDYAVVDFDSFIEVVNIIGGVDVSVQESEINHLNKIIETCYSLNEEKKGNIEYITSSGVQSLNGYQALAYARLRKTDTIYKRDERQRQILTSIAGKLSNTSITNYPKIVKSLVRHIDVNISFGKIMKLALISHELASYEIKQLEFPNEKYRKEGLVNGSFVVEWDKEKNIELINNFIYGD